MPQDSIALLADSLVQKTKEILRFSRTEEDLKIGFEKILEPTLKSIGVDTRPRYERAGAEARTVYRGRPDAVHGQVIIEYEPPKAFSSPRAVKHSYNQLVDYMSAEANSADLRRMIGVGFDGHSLFTVKYQGKADKKIDKNAFSRQGPYPFGLETARTLLTYLRALSRLPLTAENLADRFGPKSKIAPMAVSAFADALENWGGDKVRVFFREWQRLFGIVYGEQFSAKPKDESAILSQLYKVGKETDFQELLFSVHTYFALLMKFITAELLTLKETAFSSSYSDRLTHASEEELKSHLIDIEEGGIYAKRGITNFLEGDFFRWYIDAFSPRLVEAIRDMARALSEFEPATTIIEPESTRDLLKKLYQYLVPPEVRHNLGEYYTPDWLAELVLNEVGYDGNTLKRFLDPACGSGTFLVLAIQRAKEYSLKHKDLPLETVKRILSNIWGFDLNPLAVIAARTNYLLALGSLAEELSLFEIPIYLADSVLWPQLTKQMAMGFAGGDHAIVRTSIGDFHIPAIWVQDKGFLMHKAAPLIQELAQKHYDVLEAVELIAKEGLVFPPHEQVVANFYKEILDLEKQGKNGIWARFLKNLAAPMVAGQFDFVVGNPPWIRWVYLSQEYREASLPLWQGYGLFSLKGTDAWLGGSEKDFSMLFTYAAADYYLKKGAKLGFLITQEVFKSKGAGEGFRRFQLGHKTKRDSKEFEEFRVFKKSGHEPLKVIKAHDLVSVQPFEGAANKTAAIILKKGQKTEYPVPYILWARKKKVGKIPTDLRLKEAMPLLHRTKMLAQPIETDRPNSSWQTISKNQRELSKIQGQNAYRAHLGARIEPYGVFWLEIKQVLSNGDIIVRNLSEKGKRKVDSVEERIESDLVFPAIRGADIGRWGVMSSFYVLITEDIKRGAAYTESEMKLFYPRTYSYLTRFKDILLGRASHLIMSLLKHGPFFIMSGMLPHVFTRYKVVWKRMANDIIASIIAQHKTPFGHKRIIPTDTVSLFHTDSEAEAHYLCAIINSTPVRDFIKSFSSAGRGFGTPSVMEHVGIPKFDPKNSLHQKLSEISGKCHQLKLQRNEEEIEKLEKENDKMVKKLFGLKG